MRSGDIAGRSECKIRPSSLRVERMMCCGGCFFSVTFLCLPSSHMMNTQKRQNTVIVVRDQSWMVFGQMWTERQIDELIECNLLENIYERIIWFDVAPSRKRVQCWSGFVDITHSPHPQPDTGAHSAQRWCILCDILKLRSPIASEHVNKSRESTSRRLCRCSLCQTDGVNVTGEFVCHANRTALSPMPPFVSTSKYCNDQVRSRSLVHLHTADCIV